MRTLFTQEHRPKQPRLLIYHHLYFLCYSRKSSHLFVSLDSSCFTKWGPKRRRFAKVFEWRRKSLLYSTMEKRGLLRELFHFKTKTLRNCYFSLFWQIIVLFKFFDTIFWSIQDKSKCSSKYICISNVL